MIFLLTKFSVSECTYYSQYCIVIVGTCIFQSESARFPIERWKTALLETMPRFTSRFTYLFLLLKFIYLIAHLSRAFAMIAEREIPGPAAHFLIKRKAGWYAIRYDILFRRLFRYIDFK